jgi:hypothetical protein
VPLRHPALPRPSGSRAGFTEREAATALGVTRRQLRRALRSAEPGARTQPRRGATLLEPEAVLLAATALRSPTALELRRELVRAFLFNQRFVALVTGTAAAGRRRRAPRAQTLLAALAL